MLGALHQGRSHSKGFSLVELVVAIVIVGIVFALAIPSITQWIENGQIRTAAEGVKNGLQLARMEAVKSNSPTSFTLSNPGVVGGTGWGAVDIRTGNVIQVKPDGEGSNHVVLNATPGGATTVTFTGLGRRQATNADGSAVLTMIQADNPSLTNPRLLNVTISVGGEIRTCDPIVTDSGDPRKC
jgi:type IV fimbrial biogenesis protein FimT